MPCRAPHHGWVMLESSDKMGSTGEGNGISLQHSCLENTMKSSVQLLNRVQIFVTPWTAARQLPCPSPTPGAYSNSLSIESVMPSNHLILCRPLLLLPSIFPSISVCPMSQFFASGGQSVGVSVSTSVLSMNTQD